MFQSGCELWQKGFTGLSKDWRERAEGSVVGKGISVMVWTTECSASRSGDGGICATAETFEWRETTTEVECCSTLWSVAHSDVFHLMFRLWSLTCGFHNLVKDAKTQHEKLQMMYSNTEDLYTVLGQYFLFDPQKMTVDSVFIELKQVSGEQDALFSS